MSDVHSPEVRSYNMSRIKGKNTRPEELVRKYLYFHGFRYRKNVSSLPGKPDIVLPKYKTCVFVNGCFWHKHEGCRYFVWPKNNAEFWKTKINANSERDRLQQHELQSMGWNVIVVWECELKRNKQQETLTAIEQTLLNRYVNNHRCHQNPEPEKTIHQSVES